MLAHKIIYKHEDISKKDVLVYFLFGFFAFSPISSHIIMEMLHFSMSLPELFVILFYCFLPKEFKHCFSFNKRLFVRCFTFLIILLCLGIIYGKYTIRELLGTTRIYLDLIFYLSVSAKRKGPELNVIYYISFGTIIGWLLMSLYRLRTFFLISDEEGFVALGNTFAIPLGIGAAILLKDNKKFFMYLVFALLVCLLSLVRRPLFVLFCSLTIPFLFGLYSYKTKRTLLVIFLLLCLALPSLGFYLEREYPVIYRRTFEKTSEFLNGESNSDDDYRRGNIANFSIAENIMPRGLVTRETSESDGGLYIDYPFYEYFYTLGVFALLLVLVFFKNTSNIYRLYKRTHNSYVFLILLMCFVMFFLSFLEGTFLSSTYIVPMTGFVVGQIVFLTRNNRAIQLYGKL